MRKYRPKNRQYEKIFIIIFMMKTRKINVTSYE